MSSIKRHFMLSLRGPSVRPSLKCCIFEKQINEGRCEETFVGGPRGWTRSAQSKLEHESVYRWDISSVYTWNYLWECFYLIEPDVSSSDDNFGTFAKLYNNLVSVLLLFLWPTKDCETVVQKQRRRVEMSFGNCKHQNLSFYYFNIN